MKVRKDKRDASVFSVQVLLGAAGLLQEARPGLPGAGHNQIQPHHRAGLRTDGWAREGVFTKCFSMSFLFSIPK